MRISDWSSDVCSSDLTFRPARRFQSREARNSSALAPGKGRPMPGSDPITGVSEKSGGLMKSCADAGDTASGAATRAAATRFHLSSEERREGNKCVRTGRSRWAPDHEKKTKQQH